MKKVFAWLLVLCLTMSLFAGCKPAEVAPIETQPQATEPVETTAPATVAGPGAEDAMEWLKSQYQDDGALTAIDYTRYGTVRIGKTVFTVAWSVSFGEEVENPESLIKIEILDEGATVKINVNEDCEQDTPYILTATITDANGNVATHSWNYILPEAADMVAIVNEAYALKPGESFDHEVRLRGKIISLDTVYDASFQNITVTIEVEGAEGMPIKCYRLKGEGIENLLVGNIITVTGIIKNYEGTIEFDAGCILEAYEKGDAVDVPTDPGTILKQAYNLAEGGSLPYPATLTGKVTSIDSPYDPNYGNISVIIKVDGYEQYPILCYRLKGTGVDQIAVNDLITVTGIIINYRGTIEYTSGCQMIDRVSGGGVAELPSDDEAKILADAAKLADGESLNYIATLTGVITSIDTPYSSEYGNVTVTMKVGGVKFQCYRMVGDGVNMIRETDTITVSGKIKNYKGKLEFDTKCNLDSWTMGPRPVGYGPLSENTAYYLYLRQTNIGKNLFFNGQYASNKLKTTEDSTGAAAVYMVKVSGQGVRFYYMDGETKMYIEAEEYLNSSNALRGRLTVTSSPSMVWKYNSELGIYCINLPTAGNHFMGTYSDYNTVSVSWAGYIDGTMSSSGQIAAQFILPSEVPAPPEAPAEPDVPNAPAQVTDPQIGTAYKLGIEQKGKASMYYFNGTMSGYYGATTTNMDAGVDVYLEAADGGYYLYFMDASGAKKYINLEVSGTHLNFVFGDAAVSVFAWDSEYNSLHTDLDGTDCYMGTSGTYSTFSVITASNVKTSYPAHLYVPGSAPTEPSEPENTEPTEPIVPGEGYVKITSANQFVSGEYVMIVDTGYAPGVYDNKWLSAVKPNVNQNTVTSANGGVWTLTVNGSSVTITDANGNTIKPKGGNANGIDTGDYQWSWTLSGGKFRFAGVGSDTVLLASNTSTDPEYGGFNRFRGYKTTTISGNPDTYPCDFTLYIQVDDYIEPDGSEPTQPDVTEPSVTEPGAASGIEMVTSPEIGVAYKLYSEQGNLSETLFFAGTVANKDYYFATTEDVTAGVDVYLEAADGGYYLYFMKDGVKTYIDMIISGTYYNLSMTTAPGVVYTFNEEYNTLVADVSGQECYIGTYDNYTTLSCSKINYLTTGFPAHLGVIGEGTEPEVTQPTTTEPEATQPTATEPGGEEGDYVKVTRADQFVSGEYVMIVKTGYAPGVVDGTWVSAVQPTVSGNTVTNAAGGVWTLTVNGTSVTIADANGNVIKPVGGNANGITTGDYAWNWIFNSNNTFTFAGVGDDTVYLASNTSTTANTGGFNRFRAYKTSTVNGNPNGYPFEFTLYKLGGEYVEPEATEPTEAINAQVVANPVVNTGYKLGLDKGDGAVRFFTGETDATKDYFLATSTDASLAVDVYLETTDGGYYLYFMDNGVKTYIRVYTRTDDITKAKIQLTVDVPQEVFAYDEDVMTLIYDDGTNSFYMGTYGTYSTISASNTSYITGSNASKVDESQFPARFYTVEMEGEEPEVTEPEVTEPEVTEPSQPEETEPEVTEPSAPVATEVTINFADYDDGADQYVEETRDLHDMISLHITECDLKTQLRVYQDDLYDGKAEFVCTQAVTGLKINAGKRDSQLQIYGSVDGNEWVLITTLDTVSGYSDHVVEFPEGTSYKYLKLDAVGKQVFLASMTFIFG